ncbi:unnamed protein product [Rotaria sp. Silwood1]|nr:unnamed protein product [Rotaria sp. Silwood1]
MSRGQDESITVFLGDLSRDATKEEVEKTFSYYGKLRNVWLSRSPWGYGFIDFEDQRDAADAVKALDGKMICGSRVRVEFSHGRGRSNRGGRVRRRSGSRSPRTRKPFSPHDVCYECGDRGHYAYDCEIRLRRQRRMRSSSRSKSRSRSRSPRQTANGHSSRRDDKSRSRSESNRSSKDRERSYSRSRSRSRSRSDSPARSKERRSRSRTRSRSRSRVIDVNDDPNCAKCDGRAVCIRLLNKSGVSCVCLPGFALSSSTGRCILQEIPYNGICDSRYECFNGGYCSNVTSKCVCLSGYGGLMCELDINECAINDRICGSYSCTNLPGDYKCDCDFFHSGKQCQKISAVGLFVVIISSIAVVLIFIFLVLFAIRTFFTYRLSQRVSRERELQIQNPCLATLTTGGMRGDDLLSNGLSFIRPVGHRIYVPMETSFVNAMRYQANIDDDEKKQIESPPKYITNLDDSVININSN